MGGQGDFSPVLTSIELNGEGFDWLHSSVDARALYDSSSGRAHGKWATFNGTIDDREALIEARSSHISSAASKRQRQEEKLERIRESRNAQLAIDYANSLSSWSSCVHNHNTNIQRFMESVVAHTGMPPSVIPHPPPPPPSPPSYEVSTSPIQTSEKDQTINSDIVVENPDDTLHRIAQGMFGGYVNASSCATGDYPPLDDLAPY